MYRPGQAKPAQGRQSPQGAVVSGCAGVLGRVAALCAADTNHLSPCTAGLQLRWVQQCRCGHGAPACNDGWRMGHCQISETSKVQVVG